MKHILPFILLIFTLVSGCSNTNSTSKLNNVPPADYLRTQTAPSDLSIINSQLSLIRGDMGFITIKGQPDTRYTLTTSYKREGRVYNVSQWRISGRNGEAVFNWAVGSDTDTGTYPLTISGGGRTIKTFHTVHP